MYSKTPVLFSNFLHYLYSIFSRLLSFFLTHLFISIKNWSSLVGIEPTTFGLEVQRAILCAKGTRWRANTLCMSGSTCTMRHDTLEGGDTNRPSTKGRYSYSRLKTRISESSNMDYLLWQLLVKDNIKESVYIIHKFRRNLTLFY